MMVSKAILTGLLAACALPTGLACSYHLDERAAALTEPVVPNPLAKRVAAGGRCGVNFANAACDAGLCCSAAGWCGTSAAHCIAPDCQLAFGPYCDGNRVPPGPDTNNTPRPKFGTVPYGRDIFSCKVNGKIALTYDDGPWTYTEELLNTLKANNVRATFFVVGNNKNKNMINNASTPWPDLMRRMIAEGHQIASHTWGHADLKVVTQAQRKAQLVNNERALADILGYFPTYMRAPYSRLNADVYADLDTLGYHSILFDLDTHDWEGNQTVMRDQWVNAMNKGPATDYSWLAIAHDIHQYTVQTYTQFMIDQGKAKGYEFVTVGECLADPPENWYRWPSNGGSIGTPPPSATITVSNPTPTCMCPCACTAAKF